MTARQRADQLAARKAARSAAAVAKPSPTKGKGKGKSKAGTVKRRKSKASDPGTTDDAKATDADLEGLPHVDAAPEDGGPVGRLG